MASEDTKTPTSQFMRIQQAVAIASHAVVIECVSGCGGLDERLRG